MSASDTSLEAIGSRLSRLRRALGKSQAEWAEIVGVKPPSLTNIEKGRNNISVANAIRVSRYTGVSLDWIYTGSETLLPVNIARAIDALGDDTGWTDGRKRQS
jgi:transcriptional regulator with XRE-family HTH domain